MRFDRAALFPELFQVLAVAVPAVLAAPVVLAAPAVLIALVVPAGAVVPHIRAHDF